MTIYVLSFSESAYSITLYIYIYEPFGLGRFATDHSLTKAASGPLFTRVRRSAPQKNN